jgi:hypothetical protein
MCYNRIFAAGELADGVITLREYAGKLSFKGSQGCEKWVVYKYFVHVSVKANVKLEFLNNKYFMPVINVSVVSTIAAQSL